MVKTCPHCGSKVEFPLVQSRAAQAVLNYILHNPGCLRREIDRAVYGRYLGGQSNVVNQQILYLRQALPGQGFTIKRTGFGYEVAPIRSLKAKVPANACV